MVRLAYAVGSGSGEPPPRRLQNQQSGLALAAMTRARLLSQV